jgi:hypothetical protein
VTSTDIDWVDERETRRIGVSALLGRAGHVVIILLLGIIKESSLVLG